MSCDSDDLAVRSADLSYLLIKICMILDFPIFMIFWIFLLIFWIFCLGTDGIDASITFSHSNLILNSLISISGSHKPPSQWKFHFNLQSHQSLNMIYDELRFIFDQTGKDSGRAARHGGEICGRPAVGPHGLQVILIFLFTPIVWVIHWFLSSLLFLASGTEWNPRPL